MQELLGLPIYYHIKMNKNYKENLKNRKENNSKPKKLEIKQYVVKENSLLLDYLTNNLGFSRNNAKNLLSHHLVSIDGAPISQFDFSLSKGDTLIISKRPIKKKERSNLPIIYEDDEFIVIDKPFGLLSIASDKEKSSTAYRMVMDYVQQKDKHNRIFVVHRIDKETSGLLMFVKNEKLRNLLQKDWNTLVKTRGYYAVCEGVFKEKEGQIENYLRQNSLNLMYVTKDKKNSLKCITNYKVLKENKEYSLVDVHIETGRKNQIRVTLGSLGHYVLGDDKYGEPPNPINRLCLDAYELSFIHPISKKIMRFCKVLPKEFSKLVK